MSYRLLILGILVCLSPLRAFAVFNPSPVGARALGMAGAYVAIADNADSPYLNPAGMAQLRSIELTSYYTRLFGLKDLTRIMVSGVMPTPAGHIGLFYQSFGGTLYRESMLGVAWGGAVTSHIMLGVAFRALALTVRNYGAVKTSAVDAGLLVRLPYRMRYGMTVYNVKSPGSASLRDDSPPKTSLGISRGSDHLTVSFQMDHERRRGVVTRIGQAFHPIPAIAVRAGLTTAPEMVFFGLGVNVEQVMAEYALSSHPVLGLSHHISLSMRF